MGKKLTSLRLVRRGERRPQSFWEARLCATYYVLGCQLDNDDFGFGFAGWISQPGSVDDLSTRSDGPAAPLGRCYSLSRVCACYVHFNCSLRREAAQSSRYKFIKL